MVRATHARATGITKLEGAGHSHRRGPPAAICDQVGYRAWAQMAAGSGEPGSAGYGERFGCNQRAKYLAPLVFVSPVTSLPRSGSRTMTSSAAGDGSAA